MALRKSNHMRVVARGKRKPLTPPADPHAAARGQMHTEIARRLARAFMSTQAGTSYDTARRDYGHLPPGTYWMALAEQVVADWTAGRITPNRDRLWREYFNRQDPHDPPDQ
jgi:hypothetical protein